jgi:hypothetical protein
VNINLQGRKIAVQQDCGPPAAEILHLIRKLRWMGMEDEAERLNMKLCETAPTGSIITTERETD